MLLHLNLQNVILVEQLSLNLEPGMTALTGETGAGKSVIIDALQWILGERANSSIIRQGAERAEMSAAFQVNPSARAWLAEHDIDVEDEIILRRNLTTERSRYFINGVVATAQQMRELGDLLVTIHGQHQHQYLMKREHQRNLLDQYGEHQKILEQVKNSYEAWAETHQRLRLLNDDPNGMQNKLDFLRYQLTEMDDINLQPNELEKLEHQHKQLAHVDKLKHHLHQAVDLLRDHESNSTLQTIYHAQRELQQATKFSDELTTILQSIEQTRIQAEDVCNELDDYLNQLNAEPEALWQLEQRLQKIYDVARKHHVEPEQLPDLSIKLRTELNQLEELQNNADTLQTLLTTRYEHYLESAKKLRAARQHAGQRLAKAIGESMQELGMKGGQFAIHIEELNEPHAHGLDRVEFVVSANPGQPLASLSKVVSGGELSRISLAIELLTAERDNTPTLIFDEVDVGIGGATAEIVGKLLQQLGKKTQVLCITHLAQVAAQANHHIQVQKNTDGTKTSTDIKSLTPDERVLEVARMIGGTKMTEQTQKYAAELLNAAH